jgi:hypothetical protein
MASGGPKRLRIMTEASELLDRPAEAKSYRELHSRLVDAWRKFELQLIPPGSEATLSLAPDWKADEEILKPGAHNITAKANRVLR